MPSEGPRDNRQLFFANAPATYVEDGIKHVFQEFGEVTVDLMMTVPHCFISHCHFSVRS